MTLQRYRYIGAVGSHLNYPRAEYGAPTGSSVRDRASTKTHFESRLHDDLANWEILIAVTRWVHAEVCTGTEQEGCTHAYIVGT